MKTRRLHKSSRRLMAFLLSLALVMADMTILPVTALAEEPETAAEQDSSSGDAGDSTEPAGETEGVNENGSTPETTGSGSETNGSGDENGVMGLSDESTEGGSDTETPASNNADDTSELVYTLESSSLTVFDKGAKADCDTEKAGTEDYFTIIYSAKSKVDSSSKTFDDGYASAQRLNLGGVASTEKNAVKFTTSNAATVKVWWVEGGDDNRQMAILNAAGEQVAVTEETLAKNATCISTFELTEAGTYYLGGATNNNYIFKIVVTEEEAAEPITSILDTTADLTAVAQGTKADGDEESAGTDGFFTILYSAKSKVDSSSKTFDDGYTATQRLNLGGKVTTEKNAVKFTTNSAATVTVWWVEGGDDNRQMAILNASGEQVAVTEETLAKNATCISTFELADAGTYYLGGATNNNYIFKIEVVESNGSAEKEPRAAWADVAAPEITDVTVNADSIDVTVKMEIGYDGADNIVVTMTDADGETTTKKSSKEGSEVTLNFIPTASGTYTFSVVASREDEEDKAAAETKSAEFVLPLATPSFKSATSKGNGAVELAWNAVDEAESYIISADGIEDVTTAELQTTIEGLTIGQEYTFSVVAVRGEDRSEAGTITTTVVDEVQRTWAFAAFGDGINTTNNGYEGSANDGSVTVYSENGKGKIVPGSTDGLAFYYTTIDPETENFTLTADIHVDSWKLSNGQEGFGIMAADAVGDNGYGTAFWNNSYQAIASKIEYTTDEGNKISMKLGIGATVKTGTTAQDVADITAGKITMSENFSTVTDTLETSCASLGAGTYNIIGNYTGTEPTGCQSELLTDITLQLQRNNTGYYLRYLDSEGNVLGEQKYYDLDRDSLTQIDEDNIYIGFFASRNARITVSNIELTIISPEDDEAAEEREIEYVDLTSTVESAAYANSASYEFVYVANADGVLNLTDDAGNVIFENYAVTANEKVRKTITLTKQTTKLTGTFTPNADYKPTEYSLLSSYDAVTVSHTITLQTSSRSNIYVSPNGTASGAGTKEDPMSIYQAVKVAAPGTRIYIMEGTYYMDSTLKVERGINGTAKEMIYLLADPDASSRPVFDFQKKCAGMVLAGDYWYFQGFDVTNSADAQKGIQVSGDHNVLDRICTYKNGNTGLQISRYLSTDEYEDWPAYNTILNCSSYLNADKGYEDADGFAAKLTVGEGNVFDGCIAAYNADDGWDLFAKVQTGSIGVVTIQNCLAFKNGYVLDDNGNEVDAGNGNGFKMGGDSMPGAHILKNSIAFGNKAKGIDSNSGPDIQVYNSISFNNESYNVALYTNTAVNTNYIASGIVSFKTASGEGENLKFKGTQDETLVKNATNFFFYGSSSTNTNGVTVTADWFESTDMDAAINGGITRNADGTINMNGFLVLTDAADDAVAGAVLGGTASSEIEKAEETADDSNNSNNSTTDSTASDNDSDGDDDDSTDASQTADSTADTAADAGVQTPAAGTVNGQQYAARDNAQTVPETQNGQATEIAPEQTPTTDQAEQDQTIEIQPEAVPTVEIAEQEATGGVSMFAWILGIMALLVAAGGVALMVLRKKEQDAEN